MYLLTYLQWNTHEPNETLANRLSQISWTCRSLRPS